jgi:hypothetical protein
MGGPVLRLLGEMKEATSVPRVLEVMERAPGALDDYQARLARETA